MRPVTDGSLVTVYSPVGVFSYHLHVPGGHNVSNSLAAVAIAIALGIGMSTPIVAGLESYAGVSMADCRLCELGERYNALE